MSLLKNLSLRIRGKKESKYDVDREQAVELMGDKSVKVLDVRTPKEIEGTPPLTEDAIIIDFYRDDFREELMKLPKDDTYLVV